MLLSRFLSFQQGNPELTDRLQKLASRTMQTVPRPVRSVAFLTETVITDKDGPVQMFLEVNGGMGSSVIEEKGKRGHIQIIEEPVTVKGVTLETLMSETVVMSPDTHLIIKMDIEGAEYSVLNHSWTTLCNAVKEHKIHISMMLELHGQRKIGKNDALDAFNKDNIMQKLVDCGVHMARDSNSILGARFSGTWS